MMAKASEPILTVLEMPTMSKHGRPVDISKLEKVSSIWDHLDPINMYLNNHDGKRQQPAGEENYYIFAVTACNNSRNHNLGAMLDRLINDKEHYMVIMRASTFKLKMAPTDLDRNS